SSSTDPSTTETYTLSLHDALPIFDITKDAQQSTCEFDWEAAKPQLPGYRPDLSPEESEYQQALELIHKAKRPVILAGHGIIVSRSEEHTSELQSRGHLVCRLLLEK